MMKKVRWNLILVFIFIVGLSVMLYPLISNYWNEKRQSGAVKQYNVAVDTLSQNENEAFFNKAKEYNDKLSKVTSPLKNYDMVEGYEDILDVSGTGLMGYVVIDKIGAELPIYHGTSEGVLQFAVGHLQGSSLPIGGVGTHAVLSAHNGLPDAELFTNLEQMEEGDTFTLHVLNQTMTYEVNQIKIVEPQVVEDLQIEPEQDYCTLMTCTPYGVNTHRLLVRGIRIDGENAVQSVLGDAAQIDTNMVALGISLGILLVILLFFAFFRLVRKRRYKRGEL